MTNFHSRRVTLRFSRMGGAFRQTVSRRTDRPIRELSMRPNTITMGSNADTATLSAMNELLQSSTAPRSASPACTDNEI